VARSAMVTCLGFEHAEWGEGSPRPNFKVLVLFELGRMGTKDIEDRCPYITLNHFIVTRLLQDCGLNVKLFEFADPTLKLAGATDQKPAGFLG